MSTEPKKPTLAAALKYAEALARDAAEARQRDPWVKPYAPNADSVRRLVARHDGDAEAAIAYMRRRSAMWAREHREQTEASERAETRWKQRHTRYQRDTRAKRAALTPGQRLDLALCAARTISDAPVAGLGGDRVRGGERSSRPLGSGDVFGHCEAIALRAAVDVERVVDSARLRDVNAA